MSGKVSIVLDATYAAYPDRTGTGIYSENLIRALIRTIPKQTLDSYSVTLAFRPGPFVKWAWRQRWPFHIAPLLDSGLRYPGSALFHGLNQRLPKKAYPLQVATLHERYPMPSDDYSVSEFRRHMDRRIDWAITRSDRIIAVSSAVREHLREHRPELDHKVRVIHHGVEAPTPVAAHEMAAFRERVLRLAPDRPYFLNIGAVQTRKNLDGIVAAMKTIRGSILAVAGADGYGASEIRSMIAKEGMSERVRFLGHIDHSNLRLLYSTALALVFPSFEEAFGLPVLEAMSYGLPVITSNVTGMPEVAGDAALLVDPRQVEQIAEAMTRVLEDAQLREQLSIKGRKRAAQFTWERCAEQTWAVYEELLRIRPSGGGQP